MSSLPEDQPSEVARASFAKVLVEIDINSAIVPSFLVRLPRRDPFRVYVRYPKLPKICFKCGMLIHNSFACLRPSPARDEEGRLKYGLWLKDSGSLEMPPAAEVIPTEARPSPDPLDGTSGAIVPRTMVGQPFFQGTGVQRNAPDVNMQGSSNDFNTATEDFSKAIMQYMGTEYEAMIGSSFDSGSVLPMEKFWPEGSDGRQDGVQNKYA